MEPQASITIAPASAPAPLDFQGRQILELILKVKAIEKACLGDDDDDKVETDEFVGLKKEIYSTLFTTKQLIRDRYKVQVSQGNSVEAIQKGAQINRNIEALNQKFLQLKETFKRQTKKANKGISADELDVRFKEMQVIKRQIENCRDLVKGGTDYNEKEIMSLTDFLQQMAQSGIAPPTEFDNGSGGGWREPTAEEQAVMNRWSARDKDFDRQIWEVGAVVDRLNVIATEIGTKAEEQSKMVLDLSGQADEANAEVVEVNNKLKLLVSSGNGLNFCCKLLLTLILISMLGFIAQNISARVKRAVGLTPRSTALQKDLTASMDLISHGVVSGSRISWTRFSHSGIFAQDGVAPTAMPLSHDLTTAFL